MIARKAVRARPRKRGDDSVSADLADTPVPRVREVEVTRRIESDAFAVHQRGRRGRPAVARESRCARARRQIDDAERRNGPHSVREIVADVHVPRGVDHEARRARQRRISRRPAIARVPVIAVARDRRNGSVRDGAHPEIVLVGDQQYAVWHREHIHGIVQGCRNRRPAIARQSVCARSRDGGDVSETVDFANVADERVCNVDREVLIHRDPGRIAQPRLRGGPVVAGVADRKPVPARV